MRIFLGLYGLKIIESDNRFSKFNFRLRAGYSIDKAILKKRLLYDVSKWNKEKTVYIITDLAACYDCQLANIISIVLELSGINQNTVRTFAKILLLF